MSTAGVNLLPSTSLTWRDGMSFTWQAGRQMRTAKNSSGKTYTFYYTDDGIRHYKGGNGVAIQYYLDGSTILAESRSDGTKIVYMHDENGNYVGFNLNGNANYYYVYNAQGDVVGLLNESGSTVARYRYDAWGKVIAVTNNYLSAITDATHPANVNPIRYRGYYYDVETGLYYLNSRYYDPTVGRFVNADSLLSADDMSGMNLYAYCGNDPVNRVDPTGHAWYHWLAGAVVVAAFATATVMTAGGFAAGMLAVSAVGSGVAAATTASTIAAAGFIASATCYGAAVFEAASSSKNVSEFNAKGNWGTVGSTLASGAFGSATAYGGTRGSSSQRTPVIGKMKDLDNAKLSNNEFKVADMLPDMGNPKANWKQNSSVLRSFMDGRPIRDVSPYPMQNAGFLGAERNLLMNHGYVYQDGYWIMP